MRMKISEVKFLKSMTSYEKEANPLHRDRSKEKILFLWRSNVWKSSTINSLLWVKELAYSWAKAWKTRTINVFEVNKKFECMDFPGYWFAVWWLENKLKLRDMVLDYLQSCEGDLLKIVLIMDADVWPTKLDDEIFRYVYDRGFPIYILLNKADKPKKMQLESNINKVEIMFPEIPYMLYSCKTHEYRPQALELLFK